MPFPQLNDELGECQKPFLIFIQIPIVPTDRVVLAIGVVVALLGTADFIATGNHRRAPRNQKRPQQISFLLLAMRIQARIARRTLHSVITTVVVIVAVSIIFAVGFVVFMLVRDQVFQREPVMAGDVIDG